VFSVTVARAVDVERRFDSAIVWEQHEERPVQLRNTNQKELTNNLLSV
jgi:hypothetical protein